MAITFDDGFENFREHALPLLSEFRIPATVFVVSGYCGRKNDWPSQSTKVPRLPLMTWSALKEVVSAGCDLGAHTVTHPNLTGLPRADAEREMRESQIEIEQRIGLPIRSFAFPYGAVNLTLRALALEQFERACGTRLDLITTDASNDCLPRVDAYYLRNPNELKQLLEPSGQRRLAIRRWARKARQCLSR